MEEGRDERMRLFMRVKGTDFREEKMDRCDAKMEKSAFFFKTILKNRYNNSI